MSSYTVMLSKNLDVDRLNELAASLEATKTKLEEAHAACLKALCHLRRLNHELNLIRGRAIILAMNKKTLEMDARTALRFADWYAKVRQHETNLATARLHLDDAPMELDTLRSRIRATPVISGCMDVLKT